MQKENDRKLKIPLFNEAFEVISDTACNGNPSQRKNPNVTETLDFAELNSKSKDLLNRLLDIDPKFRLNSLMSLKRIAMYKEFNFEQLINRKVNFLS